MKPNQIWMLAYFRGVYRGRVEITERGVETVALPDALGDETLGSDAGDGQELHLAWSRDGRAWHPLNGNRPTWPGQFLRDPFVNRGPDGWFHLLATGGWNGVSCLHARSRDLISWEARSLPLMDGARDENGRSARNIWAPEWFFDAARGEYLVHWSSSFEDAGWKKSRLWCCRTRDWQEFTAPQVLFAPPFSAIDGTIIEHAGKYFLFHKEEEFGIHPGERRGLRLATAPRPDGPYELHHGPLNEGQIVATITEGPAILPDPRGDGWLLLYDFPMANGYGASRSPDLFSWTPMEGSELSLPPHARHGSACSISETELEVLLAAFGTAPSR